jgi:hypothetical protein
MTHRKRRTSSRSIWLSDEFLCAYTRGLSLQVAPNRHDREKLEDASRHTVVSGPVPYKTSLIRKLTDWLRGRSRVRPRPVMPVASRTDGR